MRSPPAQRTTWNAPPLLPGKCFAFLALERRSAWLAVLSAMGGPTAKEEILHEVTTGAENDLERATTLARQMVCLFGMGEKVGLARCAQRQTSPFLMGPGPDGSFQRDCSEKTAEEIDQE